MKSYVIRLFLAFAIIFSSPSIFAANIECNSCDYNAAVVKAKAAGAGTHHVYNFSSLQAWNFKVLYVAKIRSYTATYVPVDTEALKIFLAVAEYWSLNGNSLKTDLVIRPGDFNYPPSIANGSAFNAAIANTEREFYTNSMIPFIDLVPRNSLFSGLQNLANVIAMSVYGIEMTVTVYFNDGSSIKVKYTKNNSSTPEYVEGSARDSDGNRIADQSAMTNPGQFIGVSTFSTNQNLQNWIFAARLYGIPVTNGTTSGSGTGTVGVGTTQIICTNSDAGVTCKPVVPIKPN
jgi:hypothetical protein